MYKLQLSGSFKNRTRNVSNEDMTNSCSRKLFLFLLRGEPLPAKYKNHPLHGNYEGWDACHILPGWVLVWKYDNDELILCLLDTGTHSDLFKK